jgi:hypothetical protein
VAPVPDPLLLRKSGSAGNRTWTSVCVHKIFCTSAVLCYRSGTSTSSDWKRQTVEVFKAGRFRRGTRTLTGSERRNERTLDERADLLWGARIGRGDVVTEAVALVEERIQPLSIKFRD